MTTKNLATDILATYYSQTFAEHGPNSSGVGWGSPHKHWLRLQQMVHQIGPEVMEKESVLDVGCGYGELLNVLKTGFDINPRHYIGIDPSSSMIETARALYPEHRFEAQPFEKFNPGVSISHLVCCGVFTKKHYATDEQMYSLLDSFFSYGKKTGVSSLIFNLMSPLCDKRPVDLFFPRVDRIMSMIRKHWGYSVSAFSLSSDYLKYEILVHIRL